MNKIYKGFSAILILLCISISTPALATIIEGPEVDGTGGANVWGTFIDENTGWTWLDLDSVNEDTIAGMLAQVSSFGWNYATVEEVTTLLTGAGNLLPAEGPLRVLLLDIMGKINTEGGLAVRGMIDNGGVDDSHGLAQGWEEWGTSWEIYGSDIFDDSYLDYSDFGIWAYKAAPVPEPATIALLGIGLVGLAGTAVRRRLKRKAKS